MQSVSAVLASPRTSTSGRLPFALHASILIALLAASSAPTPLYPHYQAQWQLSALDITVVFSAYALALLIALLTTGTLSGHVGRGPVLLGALAVQVASMALFATAGGLTTLIGARVLQGIATGAATSAAGAALLDLEDPTRPGRPALANSIAPVTGMAAGVLAATLMVRFAPVPTITVYAALIAVFAVQAIALVSTSETVRRRPGALRSTRPHLALPSAAAHALLLNGAGVVAVWALGGFYSSLGPGFTQLVSPGGPEYAGGMVFFTMTAVAAPTVYFTRRMRADVSALRGSCAVISAAVLTLSALYLADPVPLFAGAALAGFGFGAVSQGAVRAVVDSVPAREKGGTLASYYVLSYLAMSLPAIGAGALTAGFGLRAAALAHAGCVAVLATAAVATLRSRRRTPPPDAHSGPATSANTSDSPDTSAPDISVLDPQQVRKVAVFTSSQTTDSTDFPAPSWTVGDHTVRRIDEVVLPAQTGPWLLPGATTDLVSRTPWLSPEFADEQGILRLASHSFAVELDGMRVLVDTGIGNGKRRANPAWHNLNSDYEARLRAAGFAPESVDVVILTHLHADHVGWNTRAEGDVWVPTFPNARYLTSRTEWDYWAGVDMEEARRQMFRDSVHPVREAGLFDLIDVTDEGTDVAPGIRLLPTPGHTPGQVAVKLSSRGETALATGDSIHHPVQMAHPALCSCVDIAPELAARTRNQVLDSLAGTSTLLLGSHFPPPTAGHVRREDGGYRLAAAPSGITSMGG